MMVGGHIDLPPIAAYTIGFFFFWSFGALASMLSFIWCALRRASSRRSSEPIMQSSSW
jgi:hypothetical protein